MKIEAGEYVRTKDGRIGKLDEIYYAGRGNRYYSEDLDKNYYSIKYNSDDEFGRYSDEEIVKHSKNIIDLIEVGDIVKVEGIEHVREVIEDDFFNGNIFNNDVRAIINDKNYSKQIKEYQIKSIVTKQQFSNMEYRL